jgi:hypothetical protein
MTFLTIFEKFFKMNQIDGIAFQKFPNTINNILFIHYKVKHDQWKVTE